MLTFNFFDDSVIQSFLNFSKKFIKIAANLSKLMQIYNIFIIWFRKKKNICSNLAATLNSSVDEPGTLTTCLLLISEIRRGAVPAELRTTFFQYEVTSVLEGSLDRRWIYIKNAIQCLQPPLKEKRVQISLFISLMLIFFCFSKFSVLMK